jgi:hypothetical protein
MQIAIPISNAKMTSVRCCGRLSSVPGPKGSRFQKRFQIQTHKITQNFGCPWMPTDDMNRWPLAANRRETIRTRSQTACS